MPTPQFSAPDINSFEGLRDYVIKLQRDMQYLLTNLDDLNINRLDARVIVAESITADKIAANSITADRMNVSQLSAISADLGHITAGLIEAVQIFGSYIATSQSSFPKVEFSSTDNLIRASSTSGNYVAVLPSSLNSSPAFAVYVSGLIRALIQYSIDRFLIATVSGEDIEISSGGDLYLHAGASSFVRFASWSEVFSTLDGQTLQAALNAKQNVISGATDTFTSLDGKTVDVVNGVITSIV